MGKAVYTAKVKGSPSSIQTKSVCLQGNQGQSKGDNVAEPAVTKGKVASSEFTNVEIQISD